MIDAVRVPAVGNDDVAVDEDAPFAERLEIDSGPEAPADEALDLLDATVHPTLAAVAVRARLRAPRQHGVLGGDPSPPAAFAEWGTRSSTVAAQRTRVSPIVISALPSA